MSGFFRRPVFQRGLVAPRATGTWLAPGVARGFAGRWLPDVAASAAFECGMNIVFGGVAIPAGGTSAATPLVAALMARLSDAVHRPLPVAHRWLYTRTGRHTVRDITRGAADVCDGTQPHYSASRGWDACTGLGVPNGARMLAALRREFGLSSLRKHLTRS